MATTPWTQTPGPDFQIWCPEEFDLSGSSSRVPVWALNGVPAAWGNGSANYSLIIKQYYIVFTEATPASIGDSTYDNIITVGNNTSATATDNYGSAATMQNRSIGDVIIVDQADFSGEPRVINTSNYIEVGSTGGASGVGAVRIGLLVSQDYSQWTGYSV